ncbi:MAG: hypothetical protein WD426_08545 [Anditalea sp.]
MWIKCIYFHSIFFLLLLTSAYGQKMVISFCGSNENDLYLLLEKENFELRSYANPGEAIENAPEGTGVIIVSDTYPEVSFTSPITQQMLNMAQRKKLKLYMEYPASFPGLEIIPKPVATRLERGVVTSDVFGDNLKPMSLLGINNCHILPVKVSDPLIVLGKVVGFDKAEYGLTHTKTYPLLFNQGHVMVAMTKLSNFATGRYGPDESIKQVWTYILSWMTGNKSLKLNIWPSYLSPRYGKAEELPEDARVTGIKKGVEWFYKGRFFVHPSWKDFWLKYEIQGDGTAPFGPGIDESMPIGDGSLGILEGHASTVNYDGSQQYRYWMRADVQGEVSMALAAASDMFENKDFKEKAENLVDYIFNYSNLTAGAKDDKNSDVYGMIGWATTFPETFYGDDNARAILGSIAAAAYLKTNKWDQELAEAIMGNFRRTSRQGFSGDRNEAKDILKNGWEHYWDRDYVYISPHFESWMWACYLWLYNQTGYEPLLEKTKSAIRITMEAYPAKWLWGSSFQTQRARMILPLAWLVRIEDTKEHRQWLDLVVSDLLKNQVPSGAIREEIGEGKGHFKVLKSNEDYGTDEGSLIFKNGDPVADMLYTNNFALFSLNEAAQATGNKKYEEAVDQLSDFLTRIQVKSERQKDLDGAWFRAFDYNRWDYWASNSDWGWGAWCTLTGWSQSWIVTSQILIEEDQNYWDLTKKSSISDQMQQTIHIMFDNKEK